MGCWKKMRRDKKATRKKVSPTVLYADIIGLNDDKILDLRVHKDLCAFEQGVQELFGDYSINILGIEEDTEK